MARILGRKAKGTEEKILDVDASMQGTMIFKDPVNLRINGRFDGDLNTRGNLIIGQNAVVNADIEGENITVAGTVIGNIKAKVRLRLVPPAKITGDIQTPVLGVSEGAILQGKCQMEKSASDKAPTLSKTLSVEEVAEYLEVKPSVVNEWASQGKIPAQKDNATWRFDKVVVDQWVSKEKVK